MDSKLKLAWKKAYDGKLSKDKYVGEPLKAAQAALSKIRKMREARMFNITLYRYKGDVKGIKVTPKNAKTPNVHGDPIELIEEAPKDNAVVNDEPKPEPPVENKVLKEARPVSEPNPEAVEKESEQATPAEEEQFEQPTATTKEQPQPEAEPEPEPEPKPVPTKKPESLTFEEMMMNPEFKRLWNLIINNQKPKPEPEPEPEPKDKAKAKVKARGVPVDYLSYNPGDSKYKFATIENYIDDGDDVEEEDIIEDIDDNDDDGDLDVVGDEEIIDFTPPPPPPPRLPARTPRTPVRRSLPPAPRAPPAPKPRKIREVPPAKPRKIPLLKQRYIISTTIPATSTTASGKPKKDYAYDKDARVHAYEKLLFF